MPAHGAQKPGLRELKGDLLQILFGYFFALRRILQGHIALALVDGDVQHHAQGIAALGGDFHIGQLPNKSLNYYHTMDWPN